MSTIGKKVIDKKTGDIGTILNIYCKYDKGNYAIVVKVEFELGNDFLSYEKNIKELYFLKGDDSEKFY